jgi:hypothetical protein
VVNAPKRVKVPKKTTLTHSTKKRERVETNRKDTASEKRPRKEKSKTPRKSKNVVQQDVEQHHLNADDPQFSSQACYINETRTSKIPDNLVLGNHEASKGIEEISINYTSSEKVYDHNTTVADLCFSTIIAENFLNDPDPKTMPECKKCSYWNKWKDAIEAELNSLKKRKVFTEVMPTPPRTFPIGFKWVFVRKSNENNEVVRYKTRLVAQGSEVDFNEIYSLVMNGITFQYLISLAIQKHLSLQLMDVMTAYLYVSLDSYIYMKVPDGISIPNMNANHVLCKTCQVFIWLETIGKIVVQPTEEIPPKQRIL